MWTALVAGICFQAPPFWCSLRHQIRMGAMSGEKFTVRERAEDILLGSLGFGESAVIVEVLRTPQGYKGTGSFRDGETFSFESDETPDDLQLWALDILKPGQTGKDASPHTPGNGGVAPCRPAVRAG
jgi:hypothetical protein